MKDEGFTMADHTPIILSALERIEEKVDTISARLSAHEVRAAKVEVVTEENSKALPIISKEQKDICDRVRLLENHQEHARGMNAAVRYVWGAAVASPGLVALILRYASGEVK